MLYEHSKVNLFIQAITYLAVHSWAREQPADLGYDILFENAKNQKTTVAYYHQYKK